MAAHQTAASFGRKSRAAIVQAPRALPRVIRLPDALCGGRQGFVLLTSVIRAHLGELDLQPRPQLRVGPGELEPVQDRAGVERGAADQDRRAVVRDAKPDSRRIGAGGGNFLNYYLD